MASLRSSAVMVVATLVAACAKSVPVTTNDGVTATRQAEVDRWSASLKQPTLNSSAIMSGGGESPGSVATSYGSATLTQGRGAGNARYDVSVTMPPAANRQVAWGLYTGTCSTASPPVVPTNELQPIDLDASGSGTVRGNLSATLDAKTTYNLRVYAGPRATDVNNVVLCSRLGFSGRR